MKYFDHNELKIMSDEAKQKIYELECENRILMHCLAEAFTMEQRARFLVREYNRLLDTRQGFDEQVEEFESARREYDRFEERKAMGKIVNVAPNEEDLIVNEGSGEDENDSK